MVVNVWGLSWAEKERVSNGVGETNGVWWGVLKGRRKAHVGLISRQCAGPGAAHEQRWRWRGFLLSSMWLRTCHEVSPSSLLSALPSSVFSLSPDRFQKARVSAEGEVGG